jgi:hypothetical protein
MTQPYSLAQIFPGGEVHYIKGGKFSLSNTSFRNAATQLLTPPPKTTRSVSSTTSTTPRTPT